MTHTRRTSGETLVETLVGILVCSLAAVMLMSAIVSAAHINKLAQDRDGKLQAQQQAAEQKDSSAACGSTTGTLGGTTYDLTYYGGDDMASYARS